MIRDLFTTGDWGEEDAKKQLEADAKNAGSDDSAFETDNEASSNDDDEDSKITSVSSLNFCKHQSLCTYQ